MAQILLKLANKKLRNVLCANGSVVECAPFYLAVLGMMCLWCVIGCKKSKKRDLELYNIQKEIEDVA